MNKSPLFTPNVVDINSPHKLWQGRLVGFITFALLSLSLLFWNPLLSLVVYALHNDLHSHIILVPFISGYILYILRNQLPKTYNSSIGWAIFPLTAGLVSLVSAIARESFQPTLLPLSFVCFLIAGGFLLLGKDWMKTAVFPFAFLLFMVPLPSSVADWLESASKLASADCANFFLYLTGTPVLRDGTIFQLPGIVIEVAQECSGIRSSWILFMASTLAAYLFLKRPSNRLILVMAAIPLGILRNGFRIAVIGLLCVSFGPRMIHSPIHKDGGPLFFLLSLIPLFILLWILRRNENFRSAHASR